MKTEFRKTLKDKRLEDLSDKIRRGTPVSMSEAIEVIEYQQMLRKNKVSLKDRIINFFKIK
jgi:uncharacterized protein YdcH (DUF465 family)